MKDKSFIIIADVEEVLEKNPYMIKKKKKLSKKWVQSRCTTIKAAYDKLIVNNYSTVTNDQEDHLSKIKTKTRMPTLATFIQHSTEVQANKKQKK